jgi:hypothetical protein
MRADANAADHGSPRNPHVLLRQAEFHGHGHCLVCKTTVTVAKRAALDGAPIYLADILNAA